MTTVKEFSQKIYKRDTSGKIRVLHVYTQNGTLIQVSGILDGNLITHTKDCSPKNVGRSNETTPEEQAILEAKSKIEEKLTTGYFTSLDKMDKESADVVLPMLAKDYKEMSAKVDWGNKVYAQPKLDGMRCMAIVKAGKVTLMSRQGKVIDTMDHIVKAIEKVTTPKTDFIMDGELYAHGLSFQDNMRIIKKFREGETNHVTYHLYDIVENSPYTIRNNTVNLLAQTFNCPYIVAVETNIISYTTLKHAHTKFLSEGYEGTIIRHSLAGYEMNSRSLSLLKYKDFEDMDCEVVDIIPSDARPEQGVVVCKVDGKIFKANPKMSHLEREELLKNKKDYIGRIATIVYFELSEEGIPRFPVFLGIHEDR